MSDLIVAYIRTAVPALAGSLSAWSVAQGFDFDFGAFVIPVTGFLTFAYYALVRWLETQWPFFGKFLGVRKTLTYQEPESI